MLLLVKALALLSLFFSSAAYGFESFPCGECTCDNGILSEGTLANCSSLGLRDFPVNISTLVTGLDLSYNKIDLLENDLNICKLFPNLQFVSLAGNMNTRLGPIFKDCPVLKEIDLSGNTLQTVNLSTFKGAINLQRLVLEANFLVPNALQSLSQLQVLDLSYHALSINANIFKGLTQLKELTLVLSKCQKLPSGLFDSSTNLTHLSLTGFKVKLIHTPFLSKLDNLKVLSVDLPQFQQLSLASETNVLGLESLKVQNVKEIAPLPAISSLGTLSLSGITYLPKENLFVGLENLKTLELIECSLSRIPPGWFTNLKSLEDLNLSQNGLEDLTGESFQGLQSLKYLNLSKNKLKSIPNETFAPLQGSLQLLVLSGNGLDLITKECFRYLTSLKWLDMSSNGMNTIEPGAFDGMWQLNKIYLANNLVSDLDESLFSSLPLLIELDLSSNTFSSIPKAASKSPVRILKLSENMIKSFQREVVCVMSNLTDLYLEDNPLQCSCEMREVLECLGERNTNLYGKCSAPSGLRNVALATLKKCQLTETGQADSPALLPGSGPSTETTRVLVANADRKARSNLQQDVGKERRDVEKVTSDGLVQNNRTVTEDSTSTDNSKVTKADTGETSPNSTQAVKESEVPKASPADTFPYTSGPKSNKSLPLTEPATKPRTVGTASHRSNLDHFKAAPAASPELQGFSAIQNKSAHSNNHGESINKLMKEAGGDAISEEEHFQNSLSPGESSTLLNERLVSGHNTSDLVDNTKRNDSSQDLFQALTGENRTETDIATNLTNVTSLNELLVDDIGDKNQTIVPFHKHGSGDLQIANPEKGGTNHTVTITIIITIVVVAAVATGTWLFLKNRQMGYYGTAQHESLRQDEAGDIQMHHFENTSTSPDMS